MVKNQASREPENQQSKAVANNVSPSATAGVVQREALTCSVTPLKTFTDTLQTFVKGEGLKRTLPQIFLSKYPPLKPEGSFGRPAKVTAEVEHLKTKTRNDEKVILTNVVKMAKMEQQAILGGSEEFFNAGHIVGDALLSGKKSFHYGNLIPQTNKLNLEQYHILEKKIKEHLASRPTDKVDVEANVSYEGDYALSLKDLANNKVVNPDLIGSINSKRMGAADEKINFPRWIPNKLAMSFTTRSGRALDLEDKTVGTKVPELAGDNTKPHHLIRGYKYKLDKDDGTMDFKQWTPRIGNLAQLMFPAIAKFRTWESWEEQKQAVNEFFSPLNISIFKINSAFNGIVKSGALNPKLSDPASLQEALTFIQLNATLNQIALTLSQVALAFNLSTEKEKGLPIIKALLSYAVEWYYTIAKKLDEIPEDIRDVLELKETDLVENASAIQWMLKELMS